MKKLMICLFVLIIMFFFQACRKDQEQTINKVVINEFPDITSYTTEGLGSNNPYLSLSNVTTNIVRRTNTIVVYTALEDYEVNQSGIEIAVNAYTQTFYAHYTMKNFKEEYIIIDDDGNIPKWDSYGDVANFDVCNEELQEILLSWYQELITKYDWDGVEYDVIQYPYGNLGEKLNDSKIKRSDLVDYGYNSGTVQKFMDKYQLTGDLATLICENKDIRIQWFNY